MKTKEIIEAAQSISKPYRVNRGSKFHLKDFDPADTGELKSLGQTPTEKTPR